MHDGYPGYDYETGERAGQRGRVVVVVAMVVATVLMTAVMVVVGLRDPPAAQGTSESDRAENTGAQSGEGGGSSGDEGFNPAASGAEQEGGARENAAARHPEAEDNAFPSPGGRGHEKEDRAPEGKHGGSEPPPGGVRREPGGYDPLGKNPGPGEVTTTQEERAGVAAGRFVIAVYGYSGDDANEYAQGVAGCVVWPEFYSSRGGERIRGYIEDVRRGGVRHAARLVGFEITSGGAGTVEGYAYFATARSYNRYGEVDGSRREYRQQLTLVPEGSIYKVRAASARERVGGER